MFLMFPFEIIVSTVMQRIGMIFHFLDFIAWQQLFVIGRRKKIPQFCVYIRVVAFCTPILYLAC